MLAGVGACWGGRALMGLGVCWCSIVAPRGARGGGHTVQVVSGCLSLRALAWHADTGSHGAVWRWIKMPAGSPGNADPRTGWTSSKNMLRRGSWTRSVWPTRLRMTVAAPVDIATQTISRPRCRLHRARTRTTRRAVQSLPQTCHVARRTCARAASQHKRNAGAASLLQQSCKRGARAHAHVTD